MRGFAGSVCRMRGFAGSVCRMHGFAGSVCRMRGFGTCDFGACDRRLTHAQDEPLTVHGTHRSRAVRRERALKLDDDPERPVRLRPNAHRGHHAGAPWGPGATGEVRVGQIEDHPVRVLEREESLGGAVGEIEGQLRGIRPRLQVEGAQFCREAWRKSAAADQAGKYP
jgi:hypothetical protein